VPNGWPQPYYLFAANNNALTYDGFQLGRRIFYDARLSADGVTACSSCHQQSAAFIQAAHSISHNGSGALGIRNAPGLFNMAWNTSYTWDGGVKNLELQPIIPMTTHFEMNETIADIISKISKDPLYPAMFQRAFGAGPVTDQHIFKALAQFLAVIISNNSRYDRYINGKTQFNLSESNGYTVFKDSCASCHGGPLFSDFAFRNIGLEPGKNIANYLDSGRMHITGDTADIYKFKTPSLRNVGLTGPYMHDGRFNTLLDVLDYFDTGIQSDTTWCTTLDPLLKRGIHLTKTQKNDVIAFLNTLSDSTIIYNPLFSSPKNYLPTAL